MFTVLLVSSIVVCINPGGGSCSEVPVTRPSDGITCVSPSDCEAKSFRRAGDWIEAHPGWHIRSNSFKVYPDVR